MGRGGVTLDQKGRPDRPAPGASATLYSALASLGCLITVVIFILVPNPVAFLCGALAGGAPTAAFLRILRVDEPLRGAADAGGRVLRATATWAVLGGALLLCSIGLYKLLTLGLVVEDYERHATRIAQGFIFGISFGIAAFYRSICVECLRDVEQRYFPVQQADDLDDDEQALRLANEDAEGEAGDQYLAP